MNYQGHYNALIKSRLNLNRKKGDGNYYERHHIIPKSCGGSNKKENLIFLTFREHYIAHLLLIKIYSGNLKKKMQYALWKMGNDKNKPNRILSSSQYENCRLAIFSVTKNRIVSEETREKISKANKGRKHSEETKQKLKNRIVSKEQREKISKANKGKILSEETKNKISKNNKGKLFSNETRTKLSEIGKTKIFSEETKKRISEALKGKNNPNFNKIISEETKEKIKQKKYKKCIVKGIEYKSKAEAMKILKVNYKKLHKLINESKDNISCETK